MDVVDGFTGAPFGGPRGISLAAAVKEEAICTGGNAGGAAGAVDDEDAGFATNDEVNDLLDGAM